MNPKDYTTETGRRLASEHRAAVALARKQAAMAEHAADEVERACDMFEEEARRLRNERDVISKQLDDTRAELQEATDPELLRRVNDAILALADHFGVPWGGRKADVLERVLAKVTTKETTP